MSSVLSMIERTIKVAKEMRPDLRIDRHHNYEMDSMVVRVSSPPQHSGDSMLYSEANVDAMGLETLGSDSAVVEHIKRVVQGQIAKIDAERDKAREPEPEIKAYATIAGVNYQYCRNGDYFDVYMTAPFTVHHVNRMNLSDDRLKAEINADAPLHEWQRVILLMHKARDLRVEFPELRIGMNLPPVPKKYVYTTLGESAQRGGSANAQNLMTQSQMAQTMKTPGMSDSAAVMYSDSLQKTGHLKGGV